MPSLPGYRESVPGKRANTIDAIPYATSPALAHHAVNRHPDGRADARAETKSKANAIDAIVVQ
jgi:hypothetical protein